MYVYTMDLTYRGGCFFVLKLPGEAITVLVGFSEILHVVETVCESSFGLEVRHEKVIKFMSLTVHV